jgi:hypothetical protein
MFAHVHNGGKAYYAHAGAWVPIANALHEHTSAWTDFPFAAGYGNFVDIHGGGYQTVQYRKIGDMVYIRGLAHKIDHAVIPDGAILGTLPVGFRPPGHLGFSTKPMTTSIEITAAGVVRLSNASLEFQYLDGASFSTSP